ncbi:DUF551 domain-containing protein [Methanobrevibacter sp.]|uniref:DUF551 domain-containing protein n=1 Tax=Methanobrevibacter sp. TaxID=66852 RepID=UPI00388ECDD1
MIDEKKLIETLKTCDFSMTPNVLVQESLEEIIEEQPKVGEWIPVSERLPKDFEKALTCDEHGNMHVMMHHHTFEVPFGIYESDARYYRPIAWMPLPKAYEVQE